MSFTTYAEFRAVIERMLDVAGAPYSDDGSTTVLDDAIEAAENRVYRDLKVKQMEAPFNATITGNAAPLPSDFYQAKMVRIGTGKPLRPVSLESLRLLLDGDPQAGEAEFFARERDSFLFWPAQDSGTMSGTYYKRFAAFRNAPSVVNAAYAAFPELFQYAACAEFDPIIGRDGRGAMWESKYARALRAIQLDDAQQDYMGGRVLLANSARLARGGY